MHHKLLREQKQVERTIEIIEVNRIHLVQMLYSRIRSYLFLNKMKPFLNKQSILGIIVMIKLKLAVGEANNIINLVGKRILEVLAK